MTGRYCFHRCLSVNISGGVPGLRFSGGGGTWSQIFGGGWGGYLVSDFRGGYLVSENCYGYTAGGMPLAFTQEDFLVIVIVSRKIYQSWLIMCHCAGYCSVILLFRIETGVCTLSPKSDSLLLNFVFHLSLVNKFTPLIKIENANKG